MADRLWILCCENYRREAEAVLESEPPGEVRLSVFPADCGQPRVAWSGIEALLEASERGKEEEVHLLGGGCLLKIGPPPPSISPCVVHSAGHCCEFLVGKTLVESWFERNAYVMSSGWLCRWRHYMDVWKMDPAMARAFFGESARSIVLLDSGVYRSIPEKIREFGEYVGRSIDVFPTGLDHFRLFVGGFLSDWRLRCEKRASLAGISRANRQASELYMTMDLVGELAVLGAESEVVRKTLDLFAILFAPATLSFASFRDGASGVVFHQESDRKDGSEVLDAFRTGGEESALSPGGGGFLVRVSHHDETLGAILVEGVRFPEYLDHYRNLAQTVVKVCGLSISNALAYEHLGDTVDKLKEALENIKTLKGLIPICMHCKKIRDDRGYWQQLESYLRDHSGAELSHGICPDCMKEHYLEFSGER